jgi:hypothetical protein
MLPAGYFTKTSQTIQLSLVVDQTAFAILAVICRSEHFAAEA